MRTLMTVAVAGAVVAAACGAPPDGEPAGAGAGDGTGAGNPTPGTVFDTTAGVTSAAWADDVTVTVGDGVFRLESDGYPDHELPAYFLIPENPAAQPFSDNTLEDFTIVRTAEYLRATPVDVTLTLSPVYLETTTPTDLGAIGYVISGARLFNDYENAERSVVALDDNISFPVDDTGHDHAAFVDECNGHPLADGSHYHYHGVPLCVTAEIDVEGEHSRMLGVLRDGFPVYGPRDDGGVIITDAELDRCSGHFGATPEFPGGIYHYHLTTDGAPYSVDCYRGEVDPATGDSAGGPPGGGPPGG